MTSICPGGGASSPKFGTAATVDYSAGLLASIFAAYDIAWLIPIIPLVGLAPLVLTTFCGADPPAIVALTAAEANALLQFQFGTADFTSGLAKFTNIALNTIWYDACQCNSGAAPTAFPSLPPPSTVPVQQLPRPTLPTVCQTPLTLAFNTGTAGTFSYLGNGNQSNPNPAYPTSRPLAHRVTVTLDAAHIATASPIAVDMAYFSSSGRIATVPVPSVDPLTWQAVIQIPPTAIFSTIEVNLAHSFSGGTGSMSIEMFCNTTVANGGSACCPPDETTQAQLAFLVDMVKLIQRQNAPFAYVPGTVHAGLTGNGELSIQGLIGVKLQPTAIGSEIGQELADPIEYFDMGWFAWGSSDGFDNRIRLTHSPQTSLPAAAGVYTKLGYSFPPGTVVTITELIREP